jgi:hypothetical protein
VSRSLTNDESVDHVIKTSERILVNHIRLASEYMTVGSVISKIRALHMDSELAQQI